MNITRAQLGRLQTLYSQLARRDNSLDTSREARLEWASQLCQRKVASFKALTMSEARHLIDSAQGVLGVRVPPHKRPANFHDARRAGLDGRHDGQEFANQPQIASAADLATIQSYYTRLGWDRTRFDAWLHSDRSPLRGKADAQIRTAADANRVRWALKGMLVHAGLWSAKP